MRVLLTGARAPATLELARLCARAGHEVHVADTDWWHICRGSRMIASVHQLPAPRRVGQEAYAAALNRLIAAVRVDTIVPTCEEIFHVAAIRAQLSARVIGESQTVLRTLHDKAAFPSATQAAGLRAPRTFPLRVARGADVNDLASGRYVIKRRFSRFATDVRLWQTGDPPPLTAHETPDAWIAQEMLDGRALCTWSVATQGQLRAHVTYAVDATAGTHGAAIHFHSESNATVRAWVSQFLAYHNLSGMFAFDFIEGGGEVRALECNPRLTSGIHCFRGLPHVVTQLLDTAQADDAAVLEPPAGLRFRSRLAMLSYGKGVAQGAGLLDASDDPWPRRLQALSWAQLLCRAAWARTDPRVLSTADIEWNGE